MSRPLVVLVSALAVLGAAGALALSWKARSWDGPARPAGFVYESFSRDGRPYAYAVHLPVGYDRGRPWPVVLFLHGHPESGTDGVGRVLHALGPVLPQVEAWPAIVVLPQKPLLHSEWEQHEAALLELVARVQARFAVDPARVYLTGLSEGGHGAWVLGARHPELWAAVVPICGYAAAYRGPVAGLPRSFEGRAAELAPGLAGTPVWAFHGEADDLVPVEETKAIVAALEAAGGHPKMTLVPGVGHDVWERAYRDPALPAWLFAQRRR